MSSEKMMAASEAASRQRRVDRDPIDCLKRRKNYMYTREYKFEVVRFYRGHNLYQTAKQFALNTKTVGRWVGDEKKKKASKKVSKRVKFVRNCQFPEVKEELYHKYKQLCKQGFKENGFWFKFQAKQLLQQMHPYASF